MRLTIRQEPQEPRESDPVGRAPLAPRRRSRGQALVEFALILPVFLLMTVGIIDAARLFAADISLTNGVREAALYAGSGAYVKWCSELPGNVPCPAGATALNYSPNPESVGYRIQGEASGLDVNRVLLSAPSCGPTDSLLTPPDTCTANSKTVTIAASYPFQPLTPMIDAIMSHTLAGHTDLGRAIWITASTTAQIQR